MGVASGEDVGVEEAAGVDAMDAVEGVNTAVAAGAIEEGAQEELPQLDEGGHLVGE